MSRVASFDIGTNSVLLLVVEIGAGGGLLAVDERIAITRLGQGVDGSGALSSEAVERTLSALSELSALAASLGVERRVAVGTAALRDAENGAEFLGRAQAIIGCPLEVISGRREAELVLAGVQGSFGALERPTLIFDVGGGSTELVLCQAGAIVALQSLAIGSVRLTERHLAADPPARAERAALEADVQRALAELPAAFESARPAELIGVAGTVTTLVTIAGALAVYDSALVNGARIERAEVLAIIERLCAMPLAARRGIAGLEPQRADVIIAGALIVDALMRRFAVDSLRVCDRGVRWGAAAAMAQP